MLAVTLWTEQWRIDLYTDEWRDYDEDNVPFERLEKVYVPDEDSLEQRMNIFHGQLYSLYRDNRKFRQSIKFYVSLFCLVFSTFVAQ